MIHRILDSYWLEGVLSAILFVVMFTVAAVLFHMAAHILFYGSTIGVVVDSLLNYN
jgi:hypothetical protein